MQAAEEGWTKICCQKMRDGDYKSVVSRIVNLIGEGKNYQEWCLSAVILRSITGTLCRAEGKKPCFLWLRAVLCHGITPHQQAQSDEGADHIRYCLTHQHAVVGKELHAHQ